MQPYIIVPSQGSDTADEWLRLGVDAQIAGQLPQAQQKYQQALRLDPRHPIATLNLAIVFAQSNLINEALLTIERASLFDDKHALIKMNWALMLHEADRTGEAYAMARAAYELSPDNNTRLALAMIAAAAGKPEAAIPIYNEILDADPKHPVAGINACFVLTLTNVGPEQLLVQRKKWWEAQRYTGPKEPHYCDRNPDRPLRVGYVGGDFKQHSAAFIFGRVLYHHSPAIEMYLYSTLPVNPAEDVRTKKFKDLAGDRWRDITAVSDEEAAKMIRHDKIDILVDLAAHTNGGRLGLFTRKPAPIQVTAWGFAHGTGCQEVDYFLADPIAVPPEERQHYVEQIVDLPCIVTLEGPEDYNLKGTSSPPLRKNGYVTFGSYARYEKMTDECLETFAAILRRVEDSRIEFKDHALRRPYAIKRIVSFMPDIDPSRILPSLATSHPDHMLAYQQADICLDPFPHGGGVVGLETLYMGVPLITLYGTQPAGRSASSVLTVMGRGDWVARSKEEYIDKAVALAENPKAMSEARKTLRDELMNSPAVKGYPEYVEAVYREMWKRYCAS